MEKQVNNTTNAKIKSQITGTVVSDKRDKTIAVLIKSSYMHPKVNKIIKKSRKFHVHDENNEAKIGDEVVAEYFRPISATKNWKLVKIKKRIV